MELSLKEIKIASKGELVLRGEKEDFQVTSVVLDSRQVTKGGVFVATVGERVDGHKFIPDVYQKGASLVITEKTPIQVEAEQGAECAFENWGNYLLVENTFQALKDIAEYYRKKFDIPVVGITGSVGKTSTKEFIATVLAEKYHVLKTEGNFNNEVGVPLTLLRLRKEHQAAVVEMGISDFGEMKRLSKMVVPTVCVITNIGQCHLENLKTRDGVLLAKTEIFDYMKKGGEVCLNGDDDKLCTVAEVQGKKVHFFGLGNNPKEEVFAADIVSRGLWGSEAVIHRKIKNTLQNAIEDSFEVKIPVPGIHMVTNAAAAVCVGGILGLTQEQMIEGLGKLTAIGGRNHLIRLKDYTLIDDCYNANPVSMKAAIDLLAMADTEKTAILGDMFELGTDSDKMHKEVGEYAAKAGMDCIFCVGINSRHMYEAALQEASSAQKVAYFADKEQLLEVLKQKKETLLSKGNTILLKASHGMQFAEVVKFLQEE